MKSKELDLTLSTGTVSEIQRCQDSLLELKATTGRFGSQKLTLKLMKSKKETLVQGQQLAIRKK